MSHSPPTPERAASPEDAAPSESEVSYVSSTADALPPAEVDIPWSSSSSSSGGIPEFSTRAWPVEHLLRSEMQMVLDHLHQSIPTMQPNPNPNSQPQSTPNSTIQARLEASRRGTVAIITRYRLIMERAEFLRITRVYRNSRRWMARHTGMFGLTFARNVQQRLAPFIRRVTLVTRLYSWRLDRLCVEVAGQVQAAETNQAIDVAFTRFFNEARELDAERQGEVGSIFRRVQVRLAGTLTNLLPWWPDVADAFFALARDGAYLVSRY